MNDSRNRLVDSMRALLRESVLPELQSDIARARLRQIMATLRDVDWDEAPLTLLCENEALQALVHGWSPTPPGNGPAEDARIPGFEKAAQRNRALRSQIARHFSPATERWEWTDAHAEAARVLADCAMARVRKVADRQP